MNFSSITLVFFKLLTCFWCLNVMKFQKKIDWRRCVLLNTAYKIFWTYEPTAKISNFGVSQDIDLLLVSNLKYLDQC